MMTATQGFPALPARRLPPSWTAKAREVHRALHPPDLCRRLGSRSAPIAYTAITRRPLEWRIAWANAGLCAVDGCEATGHGNLIFDHCHDHGWLRGLICRAHNVRLGQIDAVRHIPGVFLDLGSTPYAAIVSACAGCDAIPWTGYR